MRYIRYTLYLLVLLNGSVFAHTALKESVPAEGSVLTASPEHLGLSFTEEVRLLKLDVLSVSPSAQKKVEIGFAPESTAKGEYSYQLPRLASGDYRVDWSVLGADSHAVQGSFSFSIGSAGSMPLHHEGHTAMPDSHAGH